MRFNTGISAMMEFVNAAVRMWYRACISIAVYNSVASVTSEQDVKCDLTRVVQTLRTGALAALHHAPASA